MTIKTLTARSLTSFDDGKTLKLSIVTVEEGPMFIAIGPGMLALFHEQAAAFMAEQMRKLPAAVDARAD